MSQKNNNEQPDVMEDHFTREDFKYLAQFRIRTKIMECLEKNFKVEYLPVISEKSKEDKEEE